MLVSNSLVTSLLANSTDTLLRVATCACLCIVSTSASAPHVVAAARSLLGARASPGGIANHTIRLLRTIRCVLAVVYLGRTTVADIVVPPSPRLTAGIPAPSSAAATAATFFCSWVSAINDHLAPINDVSFL
jgi:hypothetical protein